MDAVNVGYRELAKAHGFELAKQHGSNVSQITCKILVTQIFSGVSKDTDHTRLQQSVKYREKTSACPSKNTDEREEKNNIQAKPKFFALHANAKKTFSMTGCFCYSLKYKKDLLRNSLLLLLIEV